MGSCVTFLKSLYYLAAYSSCRTDRVYRTSTGLEVSDSVQEEVCTCYTTFQGMLKSTVRILDTLYHLFKHSLARFAHSCVYYIAAGLSKRRKKCPSNSRLLFCARSVMPAPTLTPLISLLFYACSSRG